MHRAPRTAVAVRHCLLMPSAPSFTLFRKWQLPAHLRGFSAGGEESAKVLNEQSVEEERKRWRQKVEESKRTGDVVGLARAMTALRNLGAISTSAVTAAAFLLPEVPEDGPGEGDHEQHTEEDEDEFWPDEDDDEDESEEEVGEHRA